MVPLLREHRKFRITKNAEFSIEDFKAQLRLRTIENQLQQKELPKALEQNKKLREKVAEYESEVKIVHWYLETMEAGIDTKHVMEEFAKLKREHTNLKDWSHKAVMKLEDDNLYLKGNLKQTMANLKK